MQNKTEIQQTNAPQPSGQTTVATLGTAPFSTTPQDLNLKKDEKKLPTPSLTDIQRLEAQLLEHINRLTNDELKNLLAGRANEEIQLAQTASMDALTKESATQLTAETKSLEDYQAKTKAIFEENLKNLKDKEAAEIQKHLENLHARRLSLLAASTKDEQQDTMDHAYQSLQDHLGLGTMTFARPKGTKLEYNFLEDLKKNNFSMNGNGMQIQLRGNALISNDPKALGLAMAASGYKSIAVTGKPWNAIKAAKAALTAGVQEVEFDKNTLKSFQDPNMFTSFQDFLNAQKELKAISNLSAARASAQSNAANSVFNKTSQSSLANTFCQISPNEEGHKQMIEEMSIQDSAALAAELKDSTFTKNKNDYNGHEYIGSLTNPDYRKLFEENYASAVVSRAMNKLQNKDSAEAAEFIAENKNPKVRKAFYRQLDQLGTGTEAEHKAYQISMKAALIAKVIENNLHKTAEIGLTNFLGSNNITKKGDIKDANQAEIKAILMNTSTEDREDILADFNKNHNRALYKVTNGHPENAEHAAEQLQAASKRTHRDNFYRTGESASGSLILTNGKLFNNYCDLAGGAYQAVAALKKKAELERDGAISKTAGDDVVRLSNA